MKGGEAFTGAWWALNITAISIHHVREAAKQTAAEHTSGGESSTVVADESKKEIAERIAHGTWRSIARYECRIALVFIGPASIGVE